MRGTKNLRKRKTNFEISAGKADYTIVQSFKGRCSSSGKLISYGKCQDGGGGEREGRGSERRKERSPRKAGAENDDDGDDVGRREKSDCS